jgi:hypothetical protein
MPPPVFLANAGIDASAYIMVVARRCDKIRKRKQEVSALDDDEALQRKRKEAAERALAEAEERRKQNAPELPKELGRRKGPEPTRYGDWEKKGIVSDF